MSSKAVLQSSTFPLGPLDTNCYLIHNGTEAVAVDPGGPPGPVLRMLRQHGLQLTHILLTHLHFDHTFGVQELRTATGAPVYGAEADRYMLDNEFGLGGVWGLPEQEPFAYQALAEGETSMLGGLCRVLATPGHSPGGLSFYFPDLRAVYSGDALFYRSIGRTDFPKGDLTQLLSSIRDKLFTLPEETVVYPGHGPSSTVGDERRNNPYASDFSMV